MVTTSGLMPPIFENYDVIGVSNEINRVDLERCNLSGKEKCEFNRQAVESLVFFADQSATSSQKIDHREGAVKVLNIMEQIYGKDYEVCKQGILGEVAVSLSLKKLTFDVFAPTVEDDSIGKVDLWADPRDGTAFAIQIKTKRYNSDLTVNRIRADGGGNVIGISDEFRQDMQKMVKYLATAEDLPNTQRIVPLLVIVPGGEYNDNALYNQTTGIPLPEMIDRLYDGIDKAVFSKEEY